MKLVLIAFLCLYTGFLNAQPPGAVTCSDFPKPDQLEPGFASSTDLAKSDFQFSVEVNFVEKYGKWKTEQWQKPQKEAVCAAAYYLQEIWNSKKFQNALGNGPDLILKLDENGHSVPEGRSKLLSDLEKHPKILLTVAVTGYDWGCAVSPPNRVPVGQTPDQTAIWRRYIVELKGRCGAPPLIPALTNTLAHEYTHYALIGSKDSNAPEKIWSQYVSYGVGCLTQVIGFPKSEHLCDYAALTTEDSSPQELSPKR